MKDLVGSLLIAPPSLLGNFFEKTVILVTEDTFSGSMGIVLNKVSKMSLKEFSRKNNAEIDIPGYVYIGGPVNTKALVMVHSNEWSCDNTMQVSDRFSISSSSHMLTRLSMGDFPRQWRLFVGLCSWSRNQLKQELKGIPPYDHDRSWLTASADLHTVFDFDGEDQWVVSIERSGLEFAQNLFE